MLATLISRPSLMPFPLSPEEAMSRQFLAIAAVAEWSLHQLIAREQQAHASPLGPGQLGSQLYSATAASLVLLCALCRPASGAGYLDLDLRDLCRNFRSVLDAAAAGGEPNSMLVPQLEAEMMVAAEVRQAVCAYAALTLLAALDASPLCITVCLGRDNDAVSLEITADAAPEGDTALQRLAQAEVIAREAGAEVVTDSWLLPWSKQLTMPLAQSVATLDPSEATARA